MKRLLFIQTLVCLLDTAYSYYKCSYWDHHGWYHDLYCSSGCCGSYNHKYCCLNVGGIVGGVLGFCIFVAIIATIVACCCCACCPYYRGSRGTVITTSSAPITVTTVPDYQSTGGYSGPYTAKPADAYRAPPPAYS